MYRSTRLSATEHAAVIYYTTPDGEAKRRLIVYGPEDDGYADGAKGVFLARRDDGYTVVDVR